MQVPVKSRKNAGSIYRHRYKLKNAEGDTISSTFKVMNWNDEAADRPSTAHLKSKQLPELVGTL